jgi:hypothetical protein
VIAGGNFDPVPEIYPLALDPNQPESYARPGIHFDLMLTGLETTKIERAIGFEV